MGEGLQSLHFFISADDDGCTPNISPPHPSGRWLPRMLTPCILRMSRKDTGQTGFQFREKGSICSCGYTVRRIRYSTAIGQRRPLESDRELPRTIIIRKFTSIQHFWKKHLFCMSLTRPKLSKVTVYAAFESFLFVGNTEPYLLAC